MRPIGFSTGAVARGRFREALEILGAHEVDAVELSALRMEELAPLISALPALELAHFRYVSVHAPSRFGPEEEPYVVEMLRSAADMGFPIVVHPDTLHTPGMWLPFGRLLLLKTWISESR